MSTHLSRRRLLQAAGAATGAALAAGSVVSPLAAAEGKTAGGEPFRFCLNTSTIRGQKLPLVEEIEVAAKAGYSGIEPWIREIDEHVEKGGSLKDLRKCIADAGLAVESAIGFANWIVDDDAKRRQGLEAAKRDMDLVAQIGGSRIAAPPVGATGQSDLNLAAAAERYYALVETGKDIGVTPMIELWGFSKSLSRIGEVAYVAIESGHPQALMLFDVYHIYKGGSDFDGLKLLNGERIGAFHFNDYPADPPRDTIGDAHRVHCGDGVAPLTQIIRDLHATGFRGAISLELFNREYWQQDALKVATTGLDKMKAAVRLALPSQGAPE